MPTKILLILSVLFLLFIIRNCFKYPAKSKSAGRIRTILIVGLLAVIAACLFWEFSPRGMNSLLDKAGEGENYGSDSTQSYVNGGAPQQSVGILYITVSQGTIEMDGRAFHKEDGYAGCEEFLEYLLQQKESIVLRDDYASSAAYHYVTALLEERRVLYTEVIVN